jgi:hypothetical protein
MTGPREAALRQQLGTATRQMIGRLCKTPAHSAMALESTPGSKQQILL